MLDQRRADLGAEAGDDVDDAGREARLFEQLDELERRGGGELGGLDHHRVAGGERRRELPASSSSGEFHGVIAATTPSGSWRVKLKVSFLSIGMTAPSILSARPPK
jgi:hypothetical protein